jgi:hypothetical protein
LGDVVLVGKAQYVIGDAPAGCGNGYGLTFEPLGEPQRLCNPVLLLLAVLQTASRFDA